jgi:hypothetical protein
VRSGESEPDRRDHLPDSRWIRRVHRRHDPHLPGRSVSGGHVYRLVITEPDRRRWQEFASPGALSRYDQQAVLFSLERLLAAGPHEGSSPATFVLNSVDSIDVRDGVVEIVGVCSPVVVPVTSADATGDDRKTGTVP